MKGKINQIASSEGHIRDSTLYESLKPVFSHYLNCDRSKQQRRLSSESGNPLLQILDEKMDSFRYLVGYGGIGKSFDIQSVFSVRGNVPALLKDYRAIVLLCDYQSYTAPQIENNDLGFSTMRNLLADRILSITRRLEKDCTGLLEWFYSPEGQQDFHSFMERTNPQALEGADDLPESDYQGRLSVAEQDKFIYAASKLKYYLGNREFCSGFDKIMLVVDNLESQPEAFQDQLVSQYLRLYSCLRNYPEDWEDQNVYVHLLISVQPITYNRLRQYPNASRYAAKAIYKSSQLELVPYFRWIRDSAAQDERAKDIESWRRAEGILLNLCEKYDSKYAKLILGLVDMDIRRAMRLIDYVLANPVWITRQARTDGGVSRHEDYVFNNISVIRSLACGQKVIYVNSEDQLIPNLLFNTVNEDNSIISLYIIAYFIGKNAGYIRYGSEPVVYSEMLDDFNDLFGRVSEIERRTRDTTGYLVRKGIIGYSILNRLHGDGEDIAPNAKLYLTAKGRTIHDMLMGDSVLLEMFREDYYRVERPDQEFRFCSSYDLLQREKQPELFAELYGMLHEMLGEERTMIASVEANKAVNKFTSIFGAYPVLTKLKRGVDKSVDYSGKSGECVVADARFRLERELEEARIRD